VKSVIDVLLGWRGDVRMHVHHGGRFHFGNEAEGGGNTCSPQFVTMLHSRSDLRNVNRVKIKEHFQGMALI